MDKQIQELENGREDLLAAFRLDNSTTATLHHAKGKGEMAIRQVRKDTEVLVKVQLQDLVLMARLAEQFLGRMV